MVLGAWENAAGGGGASQSGSVTARWTPVAVRGNVARPRRVTGETRIFGARGGGVMYNAERRSLQTAAPRPPPRPFPIAVPWVFWPVHLALCHWGRAGVSWHARTREPSMDGWAMTHYSGAKPGWIRSISGRMRGRGGATGQAWAGRPRIHRGGSHVNMTESVQSGAWGAPTAHAPPPPVRRTDVPGRVHLRRHQRMADPSTWSVLGGT